MYNIYIIDQQLENILFFFSIYYPQHFYNMIRRRKEKKNKDVKIKNIILMASIRKSPDIAND